MYPESSVNYLTFDIVVSDTQEYPREFYKEIEELGLTDVDIITAHARNKGYTMSDQIVTIKMALSRGEIESISRVIECSENSNWTNLELESEEIITVVGEFNAVLNYIDHFIVEIN